MKKLFFILLIFTGIFMIVGFSFNISFDKSIASSANDPEENSAPKSLSDETNKEIRQILQDIKTELQPNYNIALVSNKSPSNKIVIEVIGTQEYFESVKGSIKNSVKKIIEGTILKEHLVTVTRSLSSSKEREKVDKINKELIAITETISKGLRDYEEVGDIKINDQKSITIETKIKGTDQDIQTKIKKIERQAKELLKSQQLKSVSNIQTYDVSVKNSDG